jgi:hypothetical protein
VATNHWPPLKEEEEELWRMIKTFSPEQFTQWAKKVAAILVEFHSKASNTPEELIERRDKLLTSFQTYPVVTAEIKKKSHEAILEKRRSPFKAIKGGRRQKRIRPNLKGEFNL